MSAGGTVKKIWGEPLAGGASVDDAGMVERHRRILTGKPLLRRHYERWYREFLPAYRDTVELRGPLIEIGSGAGFLEEFIPGLVKTDVTPTPFTERVLDASKMDLPDAGVRAFFLTGVLHHIPCPADFLSEAQRCLEPGGRLVMIEPNNNWLEKKLCSLLDHYEYFDESVTEWKNTDSGRMSRANLALPWVIFVRDRERFEREFPRLKIRGIRYHTFISYFVTGGMSFRAFLPAFAGPLVDAVESLASPWMKCLGTAMTIDVEKI